MAHYFIIIDDDEFSRLPIIEKMAKIKEIFLPFFDQVYSSPLKVTYYSTVQDELFFVNLN